MRLADPALALRYAVTVGALPVGQGDEDTGAGSWRRFCVLLAAPAAHPGRPFRNMKTGMADDVAAAALVFGASFSTPHTVIKQLIQHVDPLVAEQGCV